MGGTPKTRFMGTRVSGRITIGYNEAKAGCFSRLNRLYALRNSELRLRLITELHDSSSAGHRRVASTLATKAFGKIW
jgi:hypothetical protein